MRTGVFVCLLAWNCLAQTAMLEGELSAEKSIDLSRLVVRLETAEHNPVEQTNVTTEGDFRFSRLPPGAYTLIVTDQSGNEITRTPVDVHQASSPVQVQLPQNPAAQRPGGTISVSQLRHQPPARALAATQKAQRLSGSGDYRGAAAQLEKAIALDPQYAAAHANLGAQYAHLGDLGRAEAEFRKAIALDPSGAMQQANLALVLARSHRTSEAIEWGRHALAIDSTNAVAHYVLGCLLLARVETRAEGVHHLELASRDVPAAEKILAELKHARSF